MVPPSSATGAVYVETVRAALARNAEVEAEDPEDAEPVLLEYRSTSAQGGAEGGLHHVGAQAEARVPAPVGLEGRRGGRGGGQGRVELAAHRRGAGQQQQQQGHAGSGVREVAAMRRPRAGVSTADP